MRRRERESSGELGLAQQARKQNQVYLTACTVAAELEQPGGCFSTVGTVLALPWQGWFLAQQR